MECRQVKLLREHGQFTVEAATKGYIPCPVCNVIHTPEGDKQIHIIKGDENNDSDYFKSKPQ